MPFKKECELGRVAETVASLLRAYNQSSDEALKAWHSSLLRHAIRELEDFVTPYVSRRAGEKAAELGLPNLAGFHYDDQTRRMRDPLRLIFHWEHFVPVSELTRCLARIPTVTDDAVQQVICEADIAWILKEEDAALDAAGYRSRNRCDRESAMAAYKAVGIELVQDEKVRQ